VTALTKLIFIQLYVLKSNRDSVVGIATKLRAGWSPAGIPEGERDFLASKDFQTFSRAQPATYSMGMGNVSWW